MYIPIHFFQEEIKVIFRKTPMLEKKSGCPDGFIWRGVSYQVLEVISEWHKYKRYGRMEKNMQPEHASIAEKRGSWGVGQDFYRVKTDKGAIYEISYDRAPKNVNQRKGAWFIEREVILVETK